MRTGDEVIIKDFEVFVVDRLKVSGIICYCIAISDVDIGDNKGSRVSSIPSGT